MQMHMLVRLLFGQQTYPEAEYNLQLKNLTQIGKLILNIVDKWSTNGRMPEDIKLIKNDIFEFVNNSYRKMLYFYCPPAMPNSKQFLNWGKYRFI